MSITDLTFSRNYGFNLTLCKWKLEYSSWDLGFSLQSIATVFRCFFFFRISYIIISRFTRARSEEALARLRFHNWRLFPNILVSNFQVDLHRSLSRSCLSSCLDFSFVFLVSYLYLSVFTSSLFIRPTRRNIKLLFSRNNILFFDAVVPDNRNALTVLFSLSVISIIHFNALIVTYSQSMFLISVLQSGNHSHLAN